MHKIDIPRTIIDRGIARRGTRQVYCTLDPARTALLVIDMQNCFLVPGFSVLEVPDSRAIVDNVNALAAAVRNGVPIFAAPPNARPDVAAPDLALVNRLRDEEP